MPHEPNDFSSIHILNQYERLNNIDWLNDEEEDLEGDELFPRRESILSETIGNRFDGGMECTNEKLEDENKL